MSDKEQIIEYLKQAGVNSNIINYIAMKNLLISDIKHILGDRYISGMNIDEQACIVKLKKGTESFRITEDGNIWFCKNNIIQENDNNLIAGQIFYTGSIERIFGPKEIMLYNYIVSENDNIKDMQLRIKKRDENGKNIYDGEIEETIYNINLEKEEIQTTRWFGSDDENIPNEELETVIEKFNEFGFATRTTEQNNFIGDKWRLVKNGKSIGEKLKEEIKEETKNSGITLGRVKGFFNNLLSRNKGKEM